MKKATATIVVFLIGGLLKAQDTTKLLNHEIGFNTVLLIKQVVSNSPTLTLPQLPYSVFYNIYYKDRVGLRLGAGFSSSYSETEIPGQQLPRTTDKVDLNLRIGGSYNFVKSKRIILNCFADYVFENIKSETANTATTQVFPNPRQIITTETSETTRGEGAQAGVGIKLNIHKYISLYAELPVTYVTRVSHSRILINDTGEEEESVSTSRVSTAQVFLPTTVYLVLRF